MDFELGQITLYLSKEGKQLEDVVLGDKLPVGRDFLKKTFTVSSCECVIYCEQVHTNDNELLPWLEFINEQLSPLDKIDFKVQSHRPSGLLLIRNKNRIYAASFGRRGSTWLNKKSLESDFGIKVAMNMCGNEEVRQAKSSIHSYTTQIINRQLSQPSSADDFGMSDVEFLKYISAHLRDDKNVTLQGKNCLTVKVVGDKKIDWSRLVSLLDEYLLAYSSDAYKELFPNYPNLSPVDEECEDRLNLELIRILKNIELGRVHLSIPEFISNDEYSFTYTDYQARENLVYSHLRLEDMYRAYYGDVNKISIDHLSKHFIYAYSLEEEAVLSRRRWDLYSCLVAEIEIDGSYYILSSGEWRKVDSDFYSSIESFISNDVSVVDVDDKYAGVNIFNNKHGQNMEGEFNTKYCLMSERSIRFDKAKLRVGRGRRNLEFCDVLEVEDDTISIIQVKRKSSAASLNYLFSQTRFYCEAFLHDDVFLSDIRSFIARESRSPDLSEEFLSRIRDRTEDVNGVDYSVKMWILYDKSESRPKIENMPLMSKYDLKLTVEKLRKALKFSSVSLSYIPVEEVSVTKSVSPR